MTLLASLIAALGLSFLRAVGLADKVLETVDQFGTALFGSAEL